MPSTTNQNINEIQEPSKPVNDSFVVGNKFMQDYFTEDAEFKDNHSERDDPVDNEEAQFIDVNVDDILDSEGQPLVADPNAKGAKKKKKNHYWQRAVDTFSILAEASNIGIAVKVVASWIPAISAVGSAFGALAAIADPLIYCFRALIRITRVIGRECFDITLDEEENGKRHRWQTAGDLASLALFAIAIPLFFGLMITSPVGVTIAWVLAISGIGVSSYFDYHHPAKVAKQQYEFTLEKFNNHLATREEVDTAHHEYIKLRTSKRLFFTLIVNISFLVICSSMIPFAPPMIVPALIILTKVTSGCLALIAVSRLYNFAKDPVTAFIERTMTKIKGFLGIKAESELEQDVQPDLENQLQNEEQAGLMSSAKIQQGIQDNTSPLHLSVVVPVETHEIPFTDPLDVVIPSVKKAGPVATIKTPKGLSHNRLFENYIREDGLVNRHGKQVHAASNALR